MSVRRNFVWGWLVIAAAVVGAALIPVKAHADPPGRLVYEIEVGAPGTRSQGWTATLYDAVGDPMEAAAGQTLTTALGEFVSLPCGAPWDACGMVRTDMAEWMKTHQANVIMDTHPWVYRIYVNAEGSRNEVWTSTLLHDSVEIPAGTEPVDTPMGPFRTGGPTAVGWARVGWLPVSWQEPTPAPGQP